MVNGVIFGKNGDDAFYRVRSVLKLNPQSIHFDPIQTIDGLVHRKIPPRDLIRFYRTVSERLQIGRSIPQGLQDAMEYVDNERFVSNLAMMYQALTTEGMHLADAMEVAEFPSIDVQAVRAVQVAGKEGEVLKSLADQLEMTATIKRKIASIIWYPIMVALTAWSATYGLLMFVAPTVGAFFKKISTLDMKLPHWAEQYYAFADWFVAHAFISTVGWVAVPCFIAWAVRHPLAETIFDRIPAYHNVSMKSDLISIWSSVDLLYSANVKPVEVYPMLAATAKRQDNRERLMEMAAIYRAGNYNFAKAVAQCKFPGYVVAEIAAAESANNWSSGFKNLVMLLRQDVSRHIEQLERTTTLIAYLLIGIMIGLFFLVTLYPQMSAMMSKL